MPEPHPASGRPPSRPPRPPAPPATGEPGRKAPDPADLGPPIMVRLDDLILGDLGHPVVDADLLSAILLRNQRVGQWLTSRGVDLDALNEAFPAHPTTRLPGASCPPPLPFGSCRFSVSSGCCCSSPT